MIGLSSLSHLHCISYVRCRCYGHGIGVLWIHFLNLKIGGDTWYEIRTLGIISNWPLNLSRQHLPKVRMHAHLMLTDLLSDLLTKVFKWVGSKELEHKDRSVRIFQDRQITGIESSKSESNKVRARCIMWHDAWYHKIDTASCITSHHASYWMMDHIPKCITLQYAPLHMMDRIEVATHIRNTAWCITLHDASYITHSSTCCVTLRITSHAASHHMMHHVTLHKA